MTPEFDWAYWCGRLEVALAVSVSGIVSKSSALALKEFQEARADHVAALDADIRSNGHPEPIASRRVDE